MTLALQGEIEHSTRLRRRDASERPPLDAEASYCDSSRGYGSSIRCLIELAHLDGIEHGAVRDEPPFHLNHAPGIERRAIGDDRARERRATVATRPFCRMAAIRFFQRANADVAEAWARGDA